MKAREPARRPSVVDYEALADLRYHIRSFLRKREVAARAAGIEPQQYLVLLQLKGLQARGPATIGLLAERLQVRHHAAVQLVDRLVRAGMVARGCERRDGREITVSIQPAAERLVERLARQAMAELTTDGPALARSLTRQSARRRPPRP